MWRNVIEACKFQKVPALDMKKAKVMTTEEIQNLNIVKILKPLKFALLGSVISLSGECSQEVKRTLRLGRAVMED